jgi:hypothetical protein
MDHGGGAEPYAGMTPLRFVEIKMPQGFCGIFYIVRLDAYGYLRMNSAIRGATCSRQRRPEKMP